MTCCVFWWKCCRISVSDRWCS